MQKEKLITKILVGLTLVIATGSISTGLIRIKDSYSKPIGKSYSVLSASTRKNSYTVYGFLPYWKLFDAEYIQLDKLTDVAYFALTLNSDGTVKKYNDGGTLEPGYNHWRNNEDFHKLLLDAKSKNVRMAVTVISHVNDTTYEFLNCRSCWDTSLKELKEEMKFNDIKHLNVDFELTEPAEDDIGLKYSEYVAFLNENLDAEHGNSFVVVSTLPDSAYRQRITDLETLNEAADALFVMSYDFHRPNSETAGPVAPITANAGNTEYDVLTMLQDYLGYISPDKLILGVPYYGYNWLVYNSNPYATRIPGNDVLGYSISQTYEEINELKLKYRPQNLWDSVAQVPYFSYYRDNGTLRQVYYEDTRSLKEKYDIIKDYKLNGVGIWALGYDGGYQELWQLLQTEFVDIDL